MKSENACNFHDIDMNGLFFNLLHKENYFILSFRLENEMDHLEMNILIPWSTEIFSMYI